MAGVTAMQRRQDRIGGMIPGILQMAGGIVGGAFGGPAGAAAGSKVGGMVGGAVSEPNKQPQAVVSSPTPQPAAGLSSPGATGKVDPMARRLEQNGGGSDLAAAEAALPALSPEEQKRYAPTIMNARRYERAQGGY